MCLHRHGCLGLDAAFLCCVCLFTVRASNAPVRATGGFGSVIFSAFTDVLAKGGVYVGLEVGWCGGQRG